MFRFSVGLGLRVCAIRIPIRFTSRIPINAFVSGLLE